MVVLAPSCIPGSCVGKVWVVLLSWRSSSSVSMSVCPLGCLELPGAHQPAQGDGWSPQSVLPSSMSSWSPEPCPRGAGMGTPVCPALGELTGASLPSCHHGPKWQRPGQQRPAPGGRQELHLLRLREQDVRSQKGEGGPEELVVGGRSRGLLCCCDRLEGAPRHVLVCAHQLHSHLFTCLLFLLVCPWAFGWWPCCTSLALFLHLPLPLGVCPAQVTGPGASLGPAGLSCSCPDGALRWFALSCEHPGASQHV